MPSKGKRAASRQAQLSKRKRRAKPGGNQVFQAEPVRPAPTEGQGRFSRRGGRRGRGSYVLGFVA